MPTPGSGAISMNDMNTEILRASGTATVSMSTIRTRYGGTGAISFADLRKAEGFVITCGVYSTKVGNNEGFAAYANLPPEFSFGSVSPNEGDGRVQFAANSWLMSAFSEGGSPTNSVIALAPASSNTDVANGNQVTAGFKVTDLTRVVLANTLYTITSAISSNDYSQAYVTYDFPDTGTVHCLLKF